MIIVSFVRIVEICNRSSLHLIFVTFILKQAETVF